MSQVPERSKTSVSGLEFRVLSRELARALDGAYVSNIYSVGESQLFRMRRPAKDGGEPSEVSLVVSPRLGAWLTERPARVETTEFTTALRSRVLRARLTRVEQVDLDRVLLFTFEGKEEGPSKLVLELMPHGNLVLVGPDGKVA
ncbi:MAG: NFACT family protein, partial [Nitrososphaerota archaeon]|nr:NFACT family protein [Nitrososphaerota archaeon]